MSSILYEKIKIKHAGLGMRLGFNVDQVREPIFLAHPLYTLQFFFSLHFIIIKLCHYFQIILMSFIVILTIAS
jgi:hypothetical protein